MKISSGYFVEVCWFEFIFVYINWKVLVCNILHQKLNVILVLSLCDKATKAITFYNTTKTGADTAITNLR